MELDWIRLGDSTYVEEVDARDDESVYDGENDICLVSDGRE